MSLFRQPFYIMSEEYVSNDEILLVGKLFFYKQRAWVDFRLVKVYRLDGALNGRKYVAVMDAFNSIHLGYPSIQSLRKAILVEQLFEDQLGDYLENLK